MNIFAKDWKVYLGAKVMAGISCGFLGSTVMTYLSEITIPQMRGSLLSSFSLSYALGGLFASIGLQVLQDTAPLEFRRIFYSEFALLAVWMVPLLLLPESPGESFPPWRAVTNFSLARTHGPPRKGQEGSPPSSWREG